jgi:hypothetical protein
MPLGVLNLNGRPFGISMTASKHQEKNLFQIMSLGGSHISASAACFDGGIKSGTAVTALTQTVRIRDNTSEGPGSTPCAIKSKKYEAKFRITSTILA